MIVRGRKELEIEVEGGKAAGSTWQRLLCLVSSVSSTGTTWGRVARKNATQLHFFFLSCTHFKSLVLSEGSEVRRRTKQNKTMRCVCKEKNRAAVFIFRGVLSVFMLRWVSISSARHVIDFHPVTFCSGVCDIHTGGGWGYYPSAVFSSSFFLASPRRRSCQHTRTYVHSIAAAERMNVICVIHLGHADRRLIAVLLTRSAGGTGGKTDTGVITKALLQPLQLKSYMGTNWDFFFFLVWAKLRVWRAAAVAAAQPAIPLT